MSEPKFSDAPCFGKEFDAHSKVCGVCLAHHVCRRKFFGKLVRPLATVLPAPTAPSAPPLSSRYPAKSRRIVA